MYNENVALEKGFASYLITNMCLIFNRNEGINAFIKIKNSTVTIKINNDMYRLDNMIDYKIFINEAIKKYRYPLRYFPRKNTFVSKYKKEEVVFYILKNKKVKIYRLNRKIKIGKNS